MLIFFIVYVVVALWGMKLNFKKDEYFYDYLSKEKTTPVKGIFILLVLFAHFNGYVTYTGTYDQIYVKVLAIIGQIMVVPFMFYSGFGVMEQIKKRGQGYVNTFPKNRILNVFLEYDLAVILFAILQVAIGEPWSFKQACLSFLIWGRSWYIFAILCLYAFTFFAFKFSGEKNYIKDIAKVILLAVLYIFIVKNFKNRYWYDTVLCYPLGMIMSLYKEKIEKLTADKLYKWCISILIVGSSAILLKVFGNNTLISVIAGYLFTSIFIVLITMRVSFGNKLLSWCGKYLFEIFILHRLPMIILDKTGLMDFNPYLSFGICVTVTLILAYWFSKGCKKLWKLISG